MHVAFALMIGVDARAARARARSVRVLWLLYPLLIAFVIVVTANHFIIDAFLGRADRGGRPRTARAGWRVRDRRRGASRPSPARS